ncbi:MAG: hypothetical protein ABJ056_14365 [Halioglobus sp.]
MCDYTYVNVPLFFKAFSAIAITALLLALYWLTLVEEDPCANARSDVSAAILAEGDDQDGLANRAILMRGACKPYNQESATKDDQ